MLAGVQVELDVVAGVDETLRAHFETWLAHGCEGHENAGRVPAYVERKFSRHLAAESLRMVLPGLGAGSAVTTSRSRCRARDAGRTHRAAAGVWSRAAHLTDHVTPGLPVREWVLAVPKRRCQVLEREAALQGAALWLFLRGGARVARLTWQAG